MSQGKELYTTDALSRAPIISSSYAQEAEDHHTQLFISAERCVIPIAGADCLQEYRMAQHVDSDCK